ncbi:hypothetical protein HMPREF1548_03677 [Clostridium sp. KLE 1755]|nr:hypothetical protein HMPREF1548_03677 [Clostridium sp. KLE 1755]
MFHFLFTLFSILPLRSQSRRPFPFPVIFFTAQYIHHSIVTTFCPLEKNLCKILWEDGSAAGCSCVPPGRHAGTHKQPAAEPGSESS